MVPGYSNTTSPTATWWGDDNSATTTSSTIYIVRRDSRLDTTPTIEETQSRRGTVVYTNYAPMPPPDPLPASRWYDPPLVPPSNRGPVGAYEATVRPRTIVWRCAPRASARRARRNWRKRPHGEKRRKLR